MSKLCIFVLVKLSVDSAVLNDVLLLHSVIDTKIFTVFVYPLMEIKAAYDRLRNMSLKTNW